MVAYGKLFVTLLLSLSSWRGWRISTTTAAAADDAVGTEEHVRRRRTTITNNVVEMDRIYCRVVEVDVEWHSPDELVVEEMVGHHPSFACWTDDDATVADLKAALPVQEQELALVVRHDVVITRTVMDPASATLWLTLDSEILLLDEAAGGSGNRQRLRRELAPKSGTNAVLVVRVTYRGSAPSLTAAQLAGRVFGLGPNAETNSLVSQVSACSFGKLKLVPASGNSALSNGVINVSVTTPVTGDSSSRALENLVQTAVTNVLGSTSTYAHTMMVFPSHPDILSSGRSFLAYGYLGGARTVFTDQWAGRLTAILHEFGHNWGLSHSGKDADRYGDMSGLMGYGSRDIGGPLTCFNAQKYFDLGWMGTKAKSLTAGTSDLPWSGSLAPFVDFPRATSSQVAVVRILGSNQRLFLQYNRKKGMNSGTRALGDQVVIVQDTGTDNQVGQQSWQLGGIINPSSTFRRDSFSAGHALVIEVCSKDTVSSPESVRLSIYLDNGVQRSTCGTSAPIATKCVEFSTDLFFVAAKNGTRTCQWLKNRPNWQALLCKKGSDAYETCPVTCKATVC